MIINACLFLPQAWRLWKTKSADGVSVVSFVGFSTLQLIGALHGYFQRDYALMTGMLASVATCGSVTVLAALFCPRAPSTDLLTRGAHARSDSRVT
jgi:MtN3 and saliva related transmembrane protein